MTLLSRLGEHAGILLRGLLMGAADIVPGVSGGTVAFVTGIYDRLLAAISAVDGRWLRLLLAGRWQAAWQAVDGGFMLALIAGILLSIFTLARLISELLHTHPLLVWSFFLGLILGSALLLMRQVGHWRGAPLFTLLLGTALAALAAFAPGAALSPTPFGLFAAGFIAVCAMILPGISGSFILVLLGMYQPVLAAVRALEMGSLLVFAGGGIAGLLVFARALHWLLVHRRAPTMGLLTGFLFGSLPVVWPWQLGREAAQTVLVWPAQYSAQSGQPAHLLACTGLMLLGGIVVWLVEWRWGARPR
jgi:putative membrane protein